MCVFQWTHRLALRKIHLDQFVSALLEVQTTEAIKKIYELV